ncbi:MAG: AMP-binding protein, partial [Burkholderiaceae bacterium]
MTKTLDQALQSLDKLTNLYDFLSSGFPKNSKALAIETPDGRCYTYQDLQRASGRMANWLVSLGAKPGDRLAVQVEKSPEAVMLYLAALRAGMIFLPLNTAYRESEIGYFLEDAKPTVVVCSPENLAWVAPLAKQAGCRHVETLGECINGSVIEKATAHQESFKTVVRGADQIAAILYTSGTTGRSKGAMLTHRNLASNALVLHHYWQWAKGDVLLHALPIFHVHGLFVALHGALFNGSCMLWLAKFDADQVIRLLPRATVMMGVPTFYVRLLADARFNKALVRRMRLFVSGSAPL